MDPSLIFKLVAGKVVEVFLDNLVGTAVVDAISSVLSGELGMLGCK